MEKSSKQGLWAKLIPHNKSLYGHLIIYNSIFKTWKEAMYWRLMG